jgi:cell migration-inducing and hyaluronan-binding protein
MSFVNGRGLGFDAISGGLGGGGAAQPPVTLSRKGKQITIPVGTNVRAGIEFKATTERTSMDLHLIELDAGSWVIVEIPGFTKATSGASVDSLDALRKATATSYYKAPDELWVKLVSPGDDGRGGHSGGVSLQVSR